MIWAEKLQINTTGGVPTLDSLGHFVPLSLLQNCMDKLEMS
jgi:hypothetical protein